MTEIDASKILEFTKPEALRLWLESNHAFENELWIKIYKKHTGILSVSWNEVVIEVLCWGWIDGIKKSLDEQSYLQRITPRKPQSMWSKKNTEHVERLIDEGRMKKAGLVHIQAAKEDGRWEKAYVVSEMQIPSDFLAILESKPNSKAFFETLNKSSRYVIAYGLISAKKPETRVRRFTKYLEMLGRDEKPK